MAHVRDEARLETELANFRAADSVKAVITKNVWVTGIPMPMLSKTPNAMLYGALDALILKTLARGPSHGYAVARFIEDTSGDAVLVEEGSLYPALYRMEKQGWLTSEWKTTDGGREAKYYRLTKAGTRRLEAETAGWI